MKSNCKHPVFLQAGFTLIEIMVGMVIGLLATIIIMQVFAFFEGQRRSTTSTADAQTNGNIALYDIQREMQMAGYGLIPYGQPGVADSPLECTTWNYGTTGVTSISPVSIVEGGTTGSDQITIRYGDTQGGGIPTQITAAPIASANVPAQDFPVISSLGCKASDVAVVINGGNCAMSRVASGVPTATVVSLSDNNTITAGAAVVNANLSCLGNWNEVTYAVNTVTGNLQRTTGGVTRDVVAGIVNLQAQYGIAAAGVPSSAANFNRVVQWVDATGSWATPSLVDRNRIKAVRLAVVARSPKMEPGPVTDSCSSLTTASPTGLCAWDATSASPVVASQAPSIDLSAVDSNWNRYRYRVFETIIPLRNVVWSKGTL